jgi:hypothetical protein
MAETKTAAQQIADDARADAAQPSNTLAENYRVTHDALYLRDGMLSRGTVVPRSRLGTAAEVRDLIKLGAVEAVAD